MLKICALASGSNGNCYYIGNGEEAILIDVGITARQVVLRMKDKGLAPEMLKAVFISHEHSDHVRGARVLCKKLDIPAYYSKKTYESVNRTHQSLAVRFFQPGISIREGVFTIYPFLKNHDAREPCSFRVEYRGLSVGVFTDIGEPCGNVTSELSKCHALFLETNYDEEMLWSGLYPAYLKKRVASGIGHLSNKQAYELLNEFAHPGLQCIFMSHLSGENNTPAHAFSELEPLKAKYDIKLADRYMPSEIFKVKL